jgi:hypothetical protein
MERVHGPVKGYYIATFACPMGDKGAEYIGYARACLTRPRSFWDSGLPPVLELCADDVRVGRSEAHQIAYERAVAALD